MYKKCTRCKEEKLFSEFSRHRRKPDGYYNQCKCCVRKHRENNKEKISMYNEEWRKNNKKAIEDYNRQYYETNSDKILESKRDYISKNKNKIKVYRINNKIKINSLKAKRRANKLNATPKWLTAEDYIKIQELYEMAQAFKLYTGQEYHVDHIIPLQGKNVCGLHVPWNLQILLGTDNLHKSNKLLLD